MSYYTRRGVRLTLISGSSENIIWAKDYYKHKFLENVASIIIIKALTLNKKLLVRQTYDRILSNTITDLVRKDGY